MARIESGDPDRTYLSFPTSYKILCDEMVRLVDNYTDKRLDEDFLIQVLETWKDSCPELLLSDGALAPQILKRIGKRRSFVVSGALKLKQ